jgi:hypothetical protein
MDSRRSTHSAGTAKFRFWPSATIMVVIPTRRPFSSKRPPPLEPREMAAEVWTSWYLPRFRMEETRPWLRVRSRPLGAPMAKTDCPTST